VAVPRRTGDPRRPQSPVTPILRRIHGGVANVPTNLRSTDIREKPGALAITGDEFHQLGLPFHWVGVATINSTVVKPEPGYIAAVWGSNVAATIRYLKFYDIAVPPVPAIHTPVFVCGLPGNAAGAGGSLPLPLKMTFYQGVAFTIVAGIGDSDATAIGASEVVVSFIYK
jgi:hypothetical protein